MHKEDKNDINLPLVSLAALNGVTNTLGTNIGMASPALPVPLGLVLNDEGIDEEKLRR